ncbi:unnamed protein product [[Candida] boidinii]|nr:unnamed protein product [[Candida] boidinii]
MQTMPQKQLKFKTTMRDMSSSKKPYRKRHEEEFNESKPWKHHSDSKFLTEEERKRYEGVWVVNRGLYVTGFMPSSKEGKSFE